jgi:hypothetical protein
MNAMGGDGGGNGEDHGQQKSEEDIPGTLRDKLSTVHSAPADYWSTVNSLQTELAQRKRRNRIFGSGTFQGDCWGFFLELVNAEFDGRKVTLSDLARELNVDRDVAGRSIEHLIGCSLVRGEAVDDNGELGYSLTIEGIALMIEYFDPRVT